MYGGYPPPGYPSMPGGYGAPGGYPPPGYPGGYPSMPGGYPGGPMTTTTSYVSIPQMYNRSVYQYSSIYNRYQPFIIPMGVPPHVAQKMMNASNIFRIHDRDFSGSLDYNEWLTAMAQMGYYMNPMDAIRLFQMIDTDRSGRLSEREFVEYWAVYGY